MADVLTWLFNDGSSSMLGADAETMSLASLQVLVAEPWTADPFAFYASKPTFTS